MDNHNTTRKSWIAVIPAIVTFFKNLDAWPLFIGTIQLFVAIFLANLIWGKLLLESPLIPILDFSLSAAGIAGLYFALRAFAEYFFKRVNYLNLYASFLIGLHFYHWLFSMTLPASWLVYWWLPFLVFIPLLKIPIDLKFTEIIRVPIIEFEPAKFIPQKLFNVLSWIIVLILSPFLLSYAAVHCILHPIRTISYIRENISAMIKLLIGVAACTTTLHLLFPNIPVLWTIGWGIMIYVGSAVLVAIIALILAWIGQKVDLQKNRWPKYLFLFISGIVFPLTIIEVLVGLEAQHNNKWSFLTLLASINFGVLVTTVLLKFVSPVIMISIYWLGSVINSFTEFLFVVKPDFRKTAFAQVIILVAVLLLLPFLLLSISRFMLLEIWQASNIQDAGNQSQKVEPVITENQKKHSEQEAGYR